MNTLQPPGSPTAQLPGIALGILLAAFLTTPAPAQEAIEFRSADGIGGQQTRLSISSGATAEVKLSATFNAQGNPITGVSTLTMTGLLTLPADGLVAGTNQLVLSNGRVGVGILTPLEMLDVGGGVRLGNTAGSNPGTIRWTGTDFQGFTGAQWVSLTIPPGGSSIFGGTGTAVVTISANTTLNGVNEYQDLTISSGVTLTHDPDRALTLKVKGTLTVNGSIDVTGKGRPGGVGGQTKNAGAPGLTGASGADGGGGMSGVNGGQAGGLGAGRLQTSDGGGPAGNPHGGSGGSGVVIMERLP